ncbi:unnamed protein product [Ixodes hexagonus]
MTSNDCLACAKVLPEDNRFLTCSECSFSYHLGNTCSGVADNTFMSMGPKKRENWRCRTCRAKDGRAASVSDVDSSQPDFANFSPLFANMNAKLDQLLPLKEKVDSLLPLTGKVDGLLVMKSAIDELKATVNELKESVDFNSAQYDTLLQKTTTNETEVRELRKEVSQLRATVSENATRIIQLQTELNETEQYSRLSNLEIHGMPVTPNENLMSNVADLANHLELSSFQPSQIISLHRLHGQRDKTPPVLIRFVSAAVRGTWLNARGKLRTLVLNKSVPQMYFNENLTQFNRNLFWQARTRGKEKGFKYIWVRNGKIFAKRTEESSPVRISCEIDLEMIN